MEGLRETFRFYTPEAYRMFGVRAEEADQLEISLIGFAHCLRSIEQRIMDGDIFADKLWHDIMANLVQLPHNVRPHYEWMEQRFLRHNCVYPELHPDAKPLQANFRSPLAQDALRFVWEFDEYMAMLHTLVAVGSIREDRFHLYMARYRTPVLRVMRMPARLAKEVVTREMYLQSHPSLETSKQRMPKIKLDPRLINLDHRDPDAPPIKSEYLGSSA